MLFSSNTTRRLTALLTAAALLSVFSSSCTIVERENRRLLNKMDEKVQPESVAMRAALAPVFIPVGSLALVTDAVVVHPAKQVPEAAEDTYNLYWKPRDVDPFRRAMLFVPIVALTPPTFATDLLMRCLFPID